jgi:hypothetical protein
MEAVSGVSHYSSQIGFLSDRVDSLEWTHRRFKIESPTHFLMAAGDFAAIAERMRLEKRVGGKAPQAEPGEKRSASAAQVAGGERTEG